MSGKGGVRERKGYLLVGAGALAVVEEEDFAVAFEARASRSIRRPSAINRFRSSLARLLPVVFVSSCDLKVDNRSTGRTLEPPGVLRLRGVVLFERGTEIFGSAGLEWAGGLGSEGGPF